jgi:hypothetical protein
MIVRAGQPCPGQLTARQCPGSALWEMALKEDNEAGDLDEAEKSYGRYIPSERGYEVAIVSRRGSARPANAACSGFQLYRSRVRIGDRVGVPLLITAPWPHCEQIKTRGSDMAVAPTWAQEGQTIRVNMAVTVYSVDWQEGVCPSFCRPPCISDVTIRIF